MDFGKVISKCKDFSMMVASLIILAPVIFILLVFFWDLIFINWEKLDVIIKRDLSES